MSNPLRALTLGALLMAMNLAATTAMAQGQPTGDALEQFRAGERASEAQTTTGDAGAAPAEATQPALPAGPGARTGLLVMLGVLAAALAVLTATRATRRDRTRQAV